MMSSLDLEPIQPSSSGAGPERAGLSRSALRDALNAATLAGLAPAALTLGVTLTLFAFIPLLFPDGRSLVPQMALNLAGALVLVTGWWLLRNRRLPLSSAGAVGAAILLVVAATNLYQLWLTQAIHQTTNILIIIVASAALLLSAPWLVLTWLVIWAIWLAIALGLSAEPAMVHYLFAMAIATAAGCLVYWQRAAYIRRGEETKAALRRSEEDLRAKSSRLTALLDNLQAGVLMEDENRLLVQTNRAMCEIFGLSQSPEELVGINVGEAAGRLIQASFTDGQRLEAEIEELGRQRLPAARREVQFRDGRVFEQDYAPIFTGDSFSGQLWLYRDITERKLAETELNWWAAKLRILYETSLEINAHQDTPSLHEAIVRRAAVLIGVHMGGLYLVQPDGATLRLAAATPPFDNLVGTVLGLGEGMAGRVAETGELLMVPDYQAWVGQAHVYAGTPFRRVLCVPLIVGGLTIGALTITDNVQTGDFDDDEVRLARLFADQAAVALDNARLRDERTGVEAALRYRAEFEDLITGLSTKFVGMAPDEIGGAVDDGLAAIGGFAGADRAYVFEFAPGGARMSNSHEWCRPGISPLTSSLQDLPVEGLSGWLKQLRHSEIIQVSGLGERLPFGAAADSQEGTVVLVPLTLGHDLAGFLGFAWTGATKRWAEDDLALLRIAGELIGGALHRKHTDDTLAERESVYRALFDHTIDAVFIIGLDGRHVAINQAACDLLGYTREELLELGVSDCVVPDEYNRAEAIMDALRDGEQFHLYERTFRRKDGSTVRAEVDAALVRDAQGAPMHFQSIARDITERKRAEEALRRSETRYRLLADIGQALSASLERESLFEVVREQTARVMDAENMYIAVYDEPNHEVEFVLCANPEDIEPGTRSSADQGLTGYIVRTGRSVLLHGDVVAQGLAELDVEAAGPPAASWLGVPMQVGAHETGDSQPRVLGMIAVQHYTDPHLYDASDEALLQAIANQAAIALENGRLLDRLQQELAERGRAEAALRESERRYRLISENSADVIWLLDLTSRRFTYISPSVHRLRGFTPEEVLAQPMDEVMTPQSYQRIMSDLPAQLQAYESGDRTARTVKYRVDQVRKDGSVVPTEVVATPLIDIEGGGIQILGASRDVTDRVRAEEELARANVALAEARDEALQASRLKSEFLATMSHELRTPLNAIIGMTGLLLDTELTERQRDYAETGRRSSETLLALINEILDFSKIEAGKLELEEQPFALAECLQNACDLVRVGAAEKGLELIKEIEAGTPAEWVGDFTRVQQMLVNLLSNAVKFTEHGQVIVRAAAVPCQGPDGTLALQFQVSDTGIGMGPDQLARLFDPFRQGDASTSRRYGGTGLGLSITQRLAQLMGGYISVRSELGRGSTFSLVVRLKVSEAGSVSAAASADAAEQRAEPPPDPANRRPLRILLAEDSPVNQKVALYLLERMGYRADVAANGREAVEAVERQPYDVILMDVQMPEMDGTEAAAAIRDRFPPEQRPHIIAMTAHALRGDRERFLAAGMDEYIAKPVRANELFNALAGVVPHWNKGESDSAPAGDAPDSVPQGGTGAADKAPALDPAALAALQNVLDCGPQEAVAQIGAIFLGYAPSLLVQMREAVAGEDAYTLTQSAHALRSGSANAAALRLAELCARVEDAGKAGDLVAAGAKLPEVESELARVKAAIEAAMVGGMG